MGPLLKAPQPQKPFRGMRCMASGRKRPRRGCMETYQHARASRTASRGDVARALVRRPPRPWRPSYLGKGPEAACRTAQADVSPGRAPLSGCPMWFHLHRQGLPLQSADSLSGCGAGAVGRVLGVWCTRLNNPHCGAHLIASNWCLVASLVLD